MCNNCSWSDHSLKIDRDRSENIIHHESCWSKGPPKGIAGDGEAKRLILGPWDIACIASKASYVSYVSIAGLKIARE